MAEKKRILIRAEKLKKEAVMVKAISKFFKRQHPYTVAFYIGRKNTQRILDCKIQKKSKLLASKED
ncbi:hypothetical protein DXV75_13770 [Alteromonas aestuariivivens]|uniref:Uncharacterized protein n=1 Tax=Alteromonas aestuariivivens TaxID=1938339 RepID=A0A3D8M4A8_9ALTE|nr:hypothetical protein DXV75_13770 [Alteromonas aestuariivivens]